MTDKTTQRDWSDVAEELYDMIYESWYCENVDEDIFIEKVLAILQEFDAQNTPNVKEPLTNEEPKPESSWVTFSNAGGIRFTGDTRTRWNIMPSLIAGNEYEYKANKFSKNWIVGKLISFTDKHAVLQNDQGYKVLQRNCTEIRAYMPEPVEHIYTTDEIMEELKYIATETDCEIVRGKIIRQLLKELGDI